MYTTCKYCHTEMIKICKACKDIINDPKKDAVIHHGNIIHTSCALDETRKDRWKKKNVFAVVN